MGGNWEALQEEHIIKSHVLASHKCLELILDPTPPPSMRLCHAQTLTHVREYVQIICALTLSTHAVPFNETTGVLRLLHPLARVNIYLFIDDFHLKMEIILYYKTFISTFGSFTTFFLQWSFGYGV
jgi:hypothetical protein